jgi:hypothetical protein
MWVGLIKEVFFSACLLVKCFHLVCEVLDLAGP